MKGALKKIFLNILNNVASRAGYELKKSGYSGLGYQKADFLYIFYNNLKQIGFEPRHIVDVGANHGYWTRETLKYFPNAFYTLVEPQYWLENSVKDILQNNAKVRFKGVGAGAVNGSFDFTIVDRDDSCTFKYTENEAKANGFEQLKLPVMTINDLLAESDWPIPDVIKIDAEGLDLAVLEGASNYWRKTEVFMVEVGIANRSFDNTFLNVANYMDKIGYTLFEVTDLNRPFDTSILWLAELAFIKKDGFIASKLLKL